MQWAKRLYCYNQIELCLGISPRQFHSFCGTPGSHLRNPEVPRNRGWKTLDYVNCCLKICILHKQSTNSVSNLSFLLISLPCCLLLQCWPWWYFHFLARTLQLKKLIEMLVDWSRIRREWCRFQQLQKVWRLLIWDFQGFSMIHFNKFANDVKVFEW